MTSLRFNGLHKSPLDCKEKENRYVGIIGNEVVT